MSKFSWLASLVVVLGVFAHALPARAQDVDAPAPRAAAAAAAAQYETMPLLDAVYKDGKVTKATSNIERLVKEVANGSQPLAPNASSFDKFFTLYQFPLMTQTDEKSLAKLPRERLAFFRNYVTGIKRPDVHDHVIQLTFGSMKEIVTKNYHPAVRYNAMLIISELNSKEPVFGGSATLPLPYADALEFMVTELRDPKQIDAVRVPALLGILRHADINAHSQQHYPPAVRQSLVKQILPVALDTKVPSDRTSEGHDWIRARALEVLAALGQPAHEPSVVKALVGVLSDPKESFDVRFAASVALGRLDFRAGAEFNGDQIARKLADLAVEAARTQLEELDAEIAIEKEKLKLQGGGNIRGIPQPIERGFSSFGGEIPVKVVKQEQRLTLNQRLLKDRMVKTRMGLEGSDGKTGAMSRPAKADYIKNVSAAVLALQKVGDLKDPKMEDRAPPIADLAKELRAKINDLERVAKTGGAPANAVAPVAPAAAESPEGPDAGPAPAVTSPEEPGAVPAPAPGAPMKKKAPAAAPPVAPAEEVP